MGLIDFLKRQIDKYYAFIEFKNDIKRDFKELWDYMAYSSHRLAYQSPGVYGISKDIINTKNEFVNRTRKIKNKVKGLEGIVLNRSFAKNNDSELNYVSNDASKSKKKSRVKRAALSVLAGIGTAVSTYKFLDGSYDKKNSYLMDKNMIENIVRTKNKYFRLSKDALVEKINKECNSEITDINKTLEGIMFMKKNIPEYNRIKINYDSRFAPKDMKKDMVNLYIQSDMTLKELSSYFDQKYGMHISSSTISKYARQNLKDNGLEFANRREAKAYYAKK